MGEKEPKEKKPDPYISRLVVKADKTGALGYEIEFQFPYGTTMPEFELARLKGLKAINDWLRQNTGPVGSAAPQNLDPAAIENLGWKLYKEGHRAGWIYANTVGAEGLAAAIKQQGKVTVGEFEYKFSGRKEEPEKFISRQPIQPKQEVREG